jgi:hypothetical protein
MNNTGGMFILTAQVVPKIIVKVTSDLYRVSLSVPSSNSRLPADNLRYRAGGVFPDAFEIMVHLPISKHLMQLSLSKKEIRIMWLSIAGLLNREGLVYQQPTVS